MNGELFMKPPEIMGNVDIHKILLNLIKLMGLERNWFIDGKGADAIFLSTTNNILIVLNKFKKYEELKKDGYSDKCIAESILEVIDFEVKNKVTKIKFYVKRKFDDGYELVLG